MARSLLKVAACIPSPIGVSPLRALFRAARATSNTCPEPILSLRVLLVSSEAMPLAKTGGLADMVSAYAAAARETGVETTILMPGYPSAFARAKGVTKVCAVPGLPGGDAVIYRARMPDSDVPVLLLQQDALYARAGFYQDEHGHDYADNALRFAVLSHAAVRIASGVRGIARRLGSAVAH